MPSLLNAGGGKKDFCGRGCEETHVLLCNLALGDESRDVSCVILNLSRQRPGESYSTVLILDDDGGRAQTDCAALAFADVIEDGSEIGIACRFFSDGGADAEGFKKCLKIGPGGSLVVNDGLRAEQGLFEVVCGGDLRQGFAIAHQNADANSAKRYRLARRVLS